jgi:hypothetical protein
MFVDVLCCKVLVGVTLLSQSSNLLSLFSGVKKRRHRSCHPCSATISSMLPYPRQASAAAVLNPTTNVPEQHEFGICACCHWGAFDILISSGTASKLSPYARIRHEEKA